MDPGTGAFTGPEPILNTPAALGFFARRGQAMPVYSYALNNPVRFVDPDGEVVWDFSSLPSRTPTQQALASRARQNFPAAEQRLNNYLKTDSGRKCAEHFKTKLNANLGELLTPNQGPTMRVKPFDKPHSGMFVDKNTSDINAKGCMVPDVCSMITLIHELAHIAKARKDGKPTADSMNLTAGEGAEAVRACFPMEQIDESKCSLSGL